MARNDGAGIRGRKRDGEKVVTLGNTTEFSGHLKFKDTLCIRGKFKGTIEASGALVVDPGAVVDADHITVSSLTVYGSVSGAVNAADKVDMMTGAVVKGDVSATRLRIADGVLFDGQCNMKGSEREIEIFSRPSQEIKSEILRSHA
jgi:cytoskeletal protein CcmA (bactofilin family)